MRPLLFILNSLSAGGTDRQTERNTDGQTYIIKGFYKYGKIYKLESPESLSEAFAANLFYPHVIDDKKVSIQNRKSERK